MTGFDVVDVIGALDAIKDIIETRGALEASGGRWRKPMSGTLTYRQRRTIASSMDLISSTRRAGGRMIGAVVKHVCWPP